MIVGGGASPSVFLTALIKSRNRDGRKDRRRRLDTVPGFGVYQGRWMNKDRT